MRQAAIYLSACNVMALCTGISLFSGMTSAIAAVLSVAELAELPRKTRFPFSIGK